MRAPWKFAAGVGRQKNLLSPDGQRETDLVAHAESPQMLYRVGRASVELAREGESLLRRGAADDLRPALLSGQDALLCALAV